MNFFHSLCVCNEPLMYTCETMSHYMSQCYMKNSILSCRIHTVLFIFSDLTTWAQCVQFLPVIPLISWAFNVTHLWTSLLSVSAHVWVECGTVQTTAAQVCALPWWVVTFFYSNSPADQFVVMVGDYSIREKEHNI